MYRPPNYRLSTILAKNHRVAVLGLGLELGLGPVLVYRVRVRFGVTVRR